jgi:hypothetical protein
MEDFPCLEFVRKEDRIIPRDWCSKWESLGGEFYPGENDPTMPCGRMIAPVGDMIFTSLSRWALPYEPFDYNSGCGTEEVERNEAIAVGAIQADYTPKEGVYRRFNDGLGFNPNISKDLLDQLGEDMGGQYLNNSAVSIDKISNSERLSVRKKPVEAPKGGLAPQDEIIPITAWQQGSYPVDPPNTVKSDGPGIIPKNVPPTEAELDAEKEGHDKQRKLWQEANDKLAPGASSEPIANKRCGESGIPDDHTCHLETGAAKDGVIAYHGTPYNIKGGFDESKIGTGEGNESYGHGLYFAEEREVAEVYRKALTKAKNRDNDTSWTRYLIGINGEKPRPYSEKMGEQSFKQLDKSNPRSVAIYYFLSSFGDISGAMGALKKSGKNEAYDALDKMVKSGDVVSIERTKKSIVGNIYTVNINANPDDLLDYDKPFKEQSQFLKSKLAHYAGLEKVLEHSNDRIIKTLPVKGDTANYSHQWSPNATGDEIYRLISNSLGGESEASNSLNESGIKGIRYLDNLSRTQGKLDSTTHNYVIFKGANVKIIAKNGQPINNSKDQGIIAYQWSPFDGLSIYNPKTGTHEVVDSGETIKNNVDATAESSIVKNDFLL